MEYLYALLENFKEKPILLAVIVLFIAIGYGVIRLSRFTNNLTAQENPVQQRKDAFEHFIDSGREKVEAYTYQGDDINHDDFYDCNYRDNHEGIIAVCDEIINTAKNKQLNKDEWEELDYFYYRRAQAHEFIGNYELAINDYQQSLKIINDQETQQRVDICYEKLKGKNDNV